MRIPYATQWIDAADVKEVIEALYSSHLTQGPRIAAFEKKVAEYCGARYAVAVNSGTAALHAACFAVGLKPGDEVITSPITFVASANCVLYCGGRPVFADVQSDTINISPEDVNNKISNKTKAVIPVHFAGQPCDLEELSNIAQKNGLVVIEDAAHALGAEYKGSKVGACKYSDMTILSFHAVKHITTGEGGMILTNREDIYNQLMMFRTHGITRDGDLMINKHEGLWFYEMQLLGFNYRITDFQCALGMKQMDKLEEFVSRRRKIVAKYDQAFRKIANIVLLKEKAENKSSWHIYPIQVKSDRHKVFDALQREGIGVNVHYIPVYLQPYYSELGYQPGICPRSEKYYSQAITLPLYPKMKDEDVDTIIEKVSAALEDCSI